MYRRKESAQCVAAVRPCLLEQPLSSRLLSLLCGMKRQRSPEHRERCHQLAQTVCVCAKMINAQLSCANTQEHTHAPQVQDRRFKS